MPTDLRISSELAGRVRLGTFELLGVAVRERDDALQAVVDQACRELKSRYGDGKSAEVPGAADARTLYKALGLDPTKTRPSNEALLRRALKGEPLYRINTLVDALNLCSLRGAAPVRALRPGQARSRPTELRRGGAGESYDGHPQGSGQRRRRDRCSSTRPVPSATPRPTPRAP